MKFWQKAVFIFIFVLAISVRFYRLGEIPAGFHADEAAFGYNAYSILKTGKDEYGKPFPIILKSFGDYKGALYSYITIPFVAIFGLNEWSVRTPTALFGIGMVLLVYLLALTITKQRNIALFSMFLQAISPMPVFLSRVQSEPLVSVFFVFLGMYFFLLWAEKRKNWYMAGFIIAWILSILTSTLPRLYLPLCIPILMMWYFPVFTRTQKKVMLCIATGVILCIAILFYSASSERFGQIGVFFKKDVVLVMEEKIREDGVGGALFLETRMFHNKIVEYGQYFLENYFQYFSYDFLVHQANQPLRERIPNIGVMMLIELPFLLTGIFIVLKRRLRWGTFLTLLFLSTPALLSFASDETPNIHRFYLESVPMCLLTGMGFVGILKTLGGMKRYVSLIAMAALFTYNSWFFLHQLFIHQPTHLPYYRDYAYKPLIAGIKKYYSQYDKIIFTKDLGSPYIHILFYWPFDPTLYQQMGSPRDLDGGGFDKYIFVPQACPSDDDTYEKQLPGQKIMYVDKSECKLSPKDILDKIYWQTGVPAFLLVEKHDRSL